jgi:hypothetical protein
VRVAVLIVAISVVACATPAQVTAPQKPAPPEKVEVPDGGFSAPVPACTAENLRQRLQVADGSWLWCVEAEGVPSPRWENVR